MADFARKGRECIRCSGTGLRDQHTLCPTCNGSGGKEQPADRDKDFAYRPYWRGKKPDWAVD